MPKEETKPQKDRYEIIEVTTETAPAYQDNESGEAVTQFELIKRIANDVEKLKRQLM